MYNLPPPTFANQNVKKMSLYQIKTPLTAGGYEAVNASNSNPPPFTATKMDSDAEFRGEHTVATPPNPMKGGYGYPKATKRSKARGRGRGRKRATASFITLAPGLKFSSKNGGRRKQSRGRMSRRNRMFGLTLARGYAGGSRTRRRRKQPRRRGGNVAATAAGFPIGYALPGAGSLNGALANPPIPVPLYSS